MSLALPVYHPEHPSQVLLKMDYALTPTAVERMISLKVPSVWVRYPGLSFLEKYMTPEAAAAQGQMFTQIAATFEHMQNEAVPKLDYGQYVDAVGGLVQQVMTAPNTAVFLGDLFTADDDLMRHSAAVTYLSLLMGLKLEGYLIQQRRHVRPDRAKDITNLGVGTMLHDLGIPHLPEETRDKYFHDGDDADPGWREHPSIGFRMVRGQIDATAATVVLHHHQRCDGSGYAGEDFSVQSGESIHIFARIVAVADQFDRLRRPPNLPEQPTVFALQMMQMPEITEKFDPKVIEALMKVVPAYTPGSRVRLSDNQVGVVTDHHPEQPCRPSVQIMDDLDRLDNPEAEIIGPTVDLRKQEWSLYITECDGIAVGPYNFRLPEAEDGWTTRGAA